MPSTTPSFASHAAIAAAFAAALLAGGTPAGPTRSFAATGGHNSPVWKRF